MTEKPWSLTIPDQSFDTLQAHLFPGDGDEHGAVILASLVETKTEFRLLAKDIILAIDGVDFVPGIRGYRMLKGEFITDQIIRARNEGLVYLAIHNHGGQDRVSFSAQDIESHERGYPALLDIARGMPVGALVFAKNAVAADIWLPNRSRIELDHMRILGSSLKRLYNHPREATPIRADERYDRQIRLFGREGQAMLADAKVLIVGLGGAGSQIARHLACIGVRNFVLVDPDRAEISNLPRLEGATGWHARSWLTNASMPTIIRNFAKRFAAPKVQISKKAIIRQNKKATVKCIQKDFCDDSIQKEILDCDYIFLAADQHRARLRFNALVHQYLIAGVQVGAKVARHTDTGEISDVYAVVRPVNPQSGCLFCNGLISSRKLQAESSSEEELESQKYGLDLQEPAASISTLNAIATAQAANDFMMWFLGLTGQGWTDEYSRYLAQTRKRILEIPRKSPDCRFCGQGADSHLAKGDNMELPI